MIFLYIYIQIFLQYMLQSREFFFFHNKFAFGEYIHVHSLVLKVWSVKCSQITMFTLKISPQSHKNVHAMGNQSNKKTNAIGIQSNKITHAVVFRATRKLMLRIQSIKKINAKGNQSNMEINAQFQGPICLETLDLSQIS